MTMFIKIFVLSIVVFQLCDVYAQQKENLTKVRQEIERLEKDLKKNVTKEKTLVDQVEDVDREIGLRKKLLNGLEKEKTNTERKIGRSRIKLNEAIQDYENMRELVSKRVVSLYKRGRTSDWEAILSLDSFNRVTVWMKYKKRIVDNDRRNLKTLQQKKETVSEQNDVLRNQLRDKNLLIAETKKESAKLEKQKRSNNNRLDIVKKDKQHILETLHKKRSAFKEIKAAIIREEEKRKAATKRIKVSNTGFGSKKGKLTWPINGSIVSKHGKQKHPTLKTWTENLGIDIRGKANDPVISINEGVVRWVTWQRGMGNLVLLDYGDGYYTVYGYLDAVYVNAGQEIKEGNVIGRVGDSNSLHQSDLHFQIWNAEKHYDPELWLR